MLPKQRIQLGLHLPSSMPSTGIARSCLLPDLILPENPSDEDIRRAWLTRRQGSLGASDLPIIMGFSGWTSVLTLWYQKRGELPLDVEELEHQRFGHLMEGVIHREFERRHPEVQVHDPKGLCVRHPLFSFLTASVDRCIFLRSNRRKKHILAPGWIPLECKNVSEYKQKEWTHNEVPYLYYAQVQAQMLVTGRDIAVLAAVIGGNRLKVYTVHRDAQLIAEMVDATRDFWEKHQQGIMPTIDGSTSTTKTILKLFEEGYRENVPHKPFGEEQVKLAQRYLRILAFEKKLDNAKNTVGNTLRFWMGTDSHARDEDAGTTVTYTGKQKEKLDEEALATKHPEYKGLVASLACRQAEFQKNDEICQALIGKIEAIQKPFISKVFERTLKVAPPSNKWLEEKNGKVKTPKAKKNQAQEILLPLSQAA